MRTSCKQAVLPVCWFLLAAAAGCGRDSGEAPSPGTEPQAVAVAVVRPLVRDQPVYSEYVGRTRGSQEVEVRARVEGILEAVHFQEGFFVEAGDLLYTIDPKPYEAAVAKAAGELARAEAAWASAQRDLNRLEPLIARNAISRQEYDNAVALEQTTRAAMQSARAALESAQLQLSYTKVTAPASGLIGKSEVEPGNLVGQAQSTLLTTISTIDPIHVRFSVSEREYLEWARTHRDSTQGRAEATNRFEMVLADGSVHPYKGSPVFADRTVDPATGTLLIEVSFPNPDHIVRPGQYARIRFPRIVPDALLIPQRAVQELQGTYTVYVVTPENTAEPRNVQPGPRAGSLWVISSGLSPDDLVVVEGIQNLRPGVPVKATLVEISPESESQNPGSMESPAPGA